MGASASGLPSQPLSVILPALNKELQQSGVAHWTYEKCKRYLGLVNACQKPLTNEDLLLARGAVEALCLAVVQLPQNDRVYHLTNAVIVAITNELMMPDFPVALRMSTIQMVIEAVGQAHAYDTLQLLSIGSDPFIQSVAITHWRLSHMDHRSFNARTLWHVMLSLGVSNTCEFKKVVVENEMRYRNSGVDAVATPMTAAELLERYSVFFRLLRDVELHAEEWRMENVHHMLKMNE